MMVLASVLPGSAFGNLDDDSSSKHWLPPVWARANLEYGVDDVFSRVSWNGTWEVDAVRSVFVDVPDIVLSDGGAGASGNAQVHLGLWLPVIEGCDWDALTTNDTLAAVGITTREACGNTIRNMSSCALAGVCPREHVDAGKVDNTAATKGTGTNGVQVMTHLGPTLGLTIESLIN